MDDIVKLAVEAVKSNRYSFSKFISPNDAGGTGAHQAGLYIPKNSVSLLFESPGMKGENKEKFGTIRWQDGTSSACRFIYYGKGSRNEYRITRLGKNFKVGEFVIIVKEDETDYSGFVLSDKNKISQFLEELEIEEQDTNSLIVIKEQEGAEEHLAYAFRPRARIIKIIGQELISNDVIALVELIKNSYDADATNIEIEVNDIFSSSGEILIRDNGLGMSHEKIVNVWLEPATPDKRTSTTKKYSPCYKRRLLGEKGIGRFAAHRLGDNIEMISRGKSDCDTTPYNYESLVRIDWEAFTEEKYLEEIPISVNKVRPAVFSGSSGTLIRVSNITPWKSIRNVRSAVLKIKGLESPIKPKKLLIHQNGNVKDPGISISITSNDVRVNKDISELKSISEVLETAFYKFTAIIAAEGEILYDYEFSRVGYSDISRTQNGRRDNLLKYDVDWFEQNPLQERNNPGEFEVSFYAWDLESSALKIAGLSDYYRNIIKPNSGIRIYRDNFRVWPYGEPDNDWLELDLTRLNAPKERTVSRNQIFGIVHISSVLNPELLDQSNREGLIVNQQYEQFYRLVSATLSLFAKERKADKIKIDKVTKKQRTEDIVTESINSLRGRVESNGHGSLYASSIDQIESAYQGKITDVLERYMMAAAIGISYSIPIHEMKLRLTSIKHVVEDIERNAEVEDRYLRELIKQLNDTEDVVRAVSSIMSRQKNQKISLAKVARNVQILKDGDLKKYNISFEIVKDKEVEVEVVPGLINTSVLNLVDNAIYWLRAKKIACRVSDTFFEPSIIVKIGIDVEGDPYLQVRDNGDGLDDPFELLIEPYYSKKSDGFGLGLYLVNEIMIRSGGKLTAYNDSGAVFQLTFKN